MTVVPVSVMGGASGANAGITQVSLRRRPMEAERYDLFVRVEASEAAEPREALEAELRVRLDGQLVGVRQLDLSTPEGRHLLTTLEAGEGAKLELELRLAGDVLPADDRVEVRVPAVEPLSVMWIAAEPDAFTELALSSLGTDDRVRVLAGGPEAWPPKAEAGDGPDVVIFPGVAAAGGCLVRGRPRGRVERGWW